MVGLKSTQYWVLSIEYWTSTLEQLEHRETAMSLSSPDRGDAGRGRGRDAPNIRLDVD